MDRMINIVRTIKTSRERPKSASYLRLKNLPRNNNWKNLEFFFQKKYLVKKVTYHIAEK